jgi:hypothetical protein
MQAQGIEADGVLGAVHAPFAVGGALAFSGGVVVMCCITPVDKGLGDLRLGRTPVNAGCQCSAFLLLEPGGFGIGGGRFPGTPHVLPLRNGGRADAFRWPLGKRRRGATKTRRMTAASSRDLFGVILLPHFRWQ